MPAATQRESESKPLQAITNFYQQNGLFADYQDDYTNSPLTIPLDKHLINLSQAQCDEVTSFFQIDLLSFIKGLAHHSKKLSNTLDFDLHTIHSDICSSSEKITETGEKLIGNLPKNTAGAIKSLFRYLIWPYIKKSYFVGRGLLKPHGFPGDYVIVEDMYNGAPKSLGLGYIYDTVFLETQLCQGLRNRKDHMKHILANYFSQRPSKKVCFMNVGCGGSREIRELAFENEGEHLELYLMDFDPLALNYSMENLKPGLSKASISPLNWDVRNLIDDNFKPNVNQCDLIYSIGLFDYLPDKILKALLKKLVTLLKDDGKLVFAHKDYTFYDPKIADWFCDWKYYPRNKQDLEQLLISLDVNMEKVSFSREKDGYIYFIIISK